MRTSRSGFSVLLVTMLVVGAAEAGERGGRIRHGGKSVGTVKENRLGGYDLYDRKGNRVGHARRSRIAPRTLEIFSPDGKRLGTVKEGRP